MLKAKLAKAALLGICMSAFMTSAAFAQMGVTTAVAPVKGAVVSAEQNALYAKQKEIDQYLFVDHADDIKAMGITINYTGVTKDTVEIGITPYSEKNADYIYSLCGNDMVNVVEAPENVIYQTGVAETGVGYAEAGVAVGAATEAGTAITPPDAAVGSTKQTGTLGSTVDPVDVINPTDDILPNDGQIYSTEIMPETSVSSDTTAADNAAKDGEVSIQTESPEAAPASDNSVIYYTTADHASQPGTDIRTVSAAENTGAVNTSADKDSNAAATALIVLAIAGGAAVAGGSILAVKRKRLAK